MTDSKLEISPLGFPWATEDPFLFCAYHRDEYPKANEQLGPAVSLSGRNLGQDFTIKDGFRMYHGEVVPGFPAHPHYGFETVTIVQEGVVDHADSLGAAGRYSSGDVQWMTAGSGVQHSEMFPLLEKDVDNPLEIFQLWLNLPKDSKEVPPHFSMLWEEEIPTLGLEDESGKPSEVRIITGTFGTETGGTPNPDSWAANPENDVAIWTAKLQAGATLKLPKSNSDVPRNIYFYKGGTLKINGEAIPVFSRVRMRSQEETEIVNGSQVSHILVLQGKPLFEPVAQYGPFVANSQYEIQQVFQKFQQTQFGGWPWGDLDYTHGPLRGRFAKHADGREEDRGPVK
ncbi:MAG: pirin family protein [Schleiferiaceae bacterium]